MLRYKRKTGSIHAVLNYDQTDMFHFSICIYYHKIQKIMHVSVLVLNQSALPHYNDDSGDP